MGYINERKYIFKIFDSGITCENRVIIFASNFFIEIIKNLLFFYAKCIYKYDPLIFYRFFFGLRIEYLEKEYQFVILK